jgi:thymidylate kinase
MTSISHFLSDSWPRDAASRLSVRRGVWIAFFGPDGAGKSAIASRSAYDLLPFFGSAHRHHLRLSLRRQQCAAVPQPHHREPRTLLLSRCKLLYLFAHCWVSYVLVTLPRLLAGHLVIFDRYFPDYRIDPRRYRLAPESVGLAAALSRHVPQPDLQIVLDAPAEYLRRRKPEVSLAELERLRLAYRQEIGGTGNSVLTDAGAPLAEVADQVNRMVLAKRRSRSRRP